MNSFKFTVTLTVKNSLAIPQIVTIPRGTVIEPKSTHLSYQSAIIAQDYTFNLKPNEERSVILNAECWNKNLSPPKGVPGKITGLKGDIKNQINIWDVSSTPKSSTVLVSPSQDARVFVALAESNQEIAHQFLVNAFDQALSDGIGDLSFRQKLTEIQGIKFVGPVERRRLVELSRDPSVYPYISAEKLRAFFIRYLGVDDLSMNTLIKVSTIIYAVNPHRLAKSMYDSAVELKELLDEQRETIKEVRKNELGVLAKEKFLSMLDAIPLLDDIK